MDLRAVQMLRRAMNGGAAPGGIHVGPAAGAGIHPTPKIEPRRRIDPTPRIEPRKVLHPTPRFEPRPVIHPTKRFEVLAPPPDDMKPVEQHTSPLPPPWKQPHWDTCPAPEAKIKIVKVQPDISYKGSLMDFYV